MYHILRYIKANGMRKSDNIDFVDRINWKYLPVLKAFFAM